jgi:hypothetical protein
MLNSLNYSQYAIFFMGVLAFLPFAIGTNDAGKDMGQAPAIPVSLDQHFADPPSGLNMMGVYSTNFDETPYCCPWNPKEFEVLPPPTQGWGVIPIICQVADVGTNGVFNSNGTVLLGSPWV